MAVPHTEELLARCHDKIWSNTWKVLHCLIVSVSYLYNLIYICQKILRNQAHKQQ